MEGVKMMTDWAVGVAVHGDWLLKLHMEMEALMEMETVSRIQCPVPGPK